MKGKNEIKINPSLGESIKAELVALKAEKVQAQRSCLMNQQADDQKKEVLAQQQAKKDKMIEESRRWSIEVR